MTQSKIRNFCIISHINHGKSTLADRFLEITGTVEKRKMREQYLDQMDLEREKGITIKLQPVRMIYHQIRNKSQGSKSKAPILNPPLSKGRKEEGLSLGFSSSDLGFVGSEFILNLIDTPGHVDFTYEVSRSLSSVEGALLLVDATQGIEAQTVANLYLALEQGLVIIPVINKIDLPNAEVRKVSQEIKDLMSNACPAFDLSLLRGDSREPGRGERSRRVKRQISEVLGVSAKTGQNVEKVLQAIIEKIPGPKGDPEKPLQALIFDSYFDEYKGVIAYLRIFNGEVKRDDLIYLIGTKRESEVLEVGYFKPEFTQSDKLQAGEIGYIVTGLKDLSACKVGDTITKSKIFAEGAAPAGGHGSASGGKNQKSKTHIKNIKYSNQKNITNQYLLNNYQQLALPGYKEIKPMVFAGLYAKEGKDWQSLREALEKLKLNDAAFSFELESSSRLGYGFRSGFLGLLHLDIIKERLKREYGLDITLTVPSVAYKIKLKIKNKKPVLSPSASLGINSVEGLKINEEIIIHSPQELPDPSQIERIEEPWLKVDIITPSCYLGQIMRLVDKKHGQYINTEYISQDQVVFHCHLPLASILVDFYDKIKSVSCGYASLNWEFLGYRPCQVQKLDILVAGEKIEPLSTIVYKENVYQKARSMVDRLKKVLPRQLFEVKIQAAIGGKIIASAKIPALRKDVTAKLYGGDVTRKMKLLEKQKKGKKKMRALGKVDIPAEVYLAMLRK